MSRGSLHEFVLYQRLSVLKRHLDRGKNVRALESATMLNKAVRGYATRLEGHFTSVSQFGENTTCTSEDAPAQQSRLSFFYNLLSYQFAK